MKQALTIANVGAFWGDQPLAASTLLKQNLNIDYITIDYLAELSLSIMAIQKEKNSDEGYAKDFLTLIRSIIPFFHQKKPFKIVTNAGGLNPHACAIECKKILKEEGLGYLKIGVVSGDDVKSLLLKNKENPLFKNLDTGNLLESIQEKLVSANAYLGAKPIAEVLQKGADIVITGRVADPSLTVGPCLAEFNWKEEEYDKLAGATIAGHLIECGTQATGGISTNWLEIPDLTNMGFPFVKIKKDGTFILTKSPHSGGVVDVNTTKEQLLYEIEDPDRYLSPDVTVSFLSLNLKDLRNNQVEITGAKGKAPSENYKVSASYKAGYKVEAYLTIFGRDARKKAELSGEIIFKRVEEAGYKLEKTKIECLGCGDVVPGIFKNYDALECVLRIAAFDKEEEGLKFLTKQIAPLVTSGPPGTTGYSSGRAQVRPAFGYWPCLISKHLLFPKTYLL